MNAARTTRSKRILATVAATAMAAALSAAQPTAAQTRALTRDQGLAKMVSTERAFAKLALDSATQKAFDRYLSHDAMVFRPRAMRAMDARARNPLPANLALAWEPEWADMSRDGDLGYTTGPWISGARNNAQADPKFGRFLTVWRRQPDGRYLALLDAGVATPATAESPKKLGSALPSGYTRKAQGTADRASMLRADNDFTSSASKNGYSAAVTPIAEPGIRLLRNGTPPVMNLDSVSSAMRGARVTWWVPVDAVVATSGDLGYTRGTYVIVLPDSKRYSGDYLRIWKRDARGAWKIAVEMLMAG